MTDKLIEAVARAIEEINDDDCPTIDIARAALAAIEASGTHRIVPMEPTDEMLEQFKRFYDWPEKAYAEMLRSIQPKVLP